MKHRRHATVLALTAAAVVLSTGGAVAGSMITGAQIKDGTVTTKDVKNRSLGASDLTKAAVAAFREPGPAGAPGLVRGYGRVSSEGVVSHQSGGITVTKPGTGIYCVRVPGVDADSSVGVVTPDFASDSTSTGPNASQAFVEYATTIGNCPTGALRFVAFVRTPVVSNGNVTGTTLQGSDQPFTFLVP